MVITSESDRFLIVLLFHMGFDLKIIAQDLNLNLRTVKKWILRHAETGSVRTYFANCGGHSVLTEEEESDILLASLENPFRNAADIKRLLGYDISLQTYRSKLDKGGLNARRAAQKETLNAIHRQNRLNFANNFINFGINNWYRTLMVDESTFCTSSYGMVLVRRPLGTRFDEQYLQSIQRSGRRSVSVWGVLTADGLGPLVRIDGRFTAERYMDILEDYAIPFINEFYAPFLNEGQNLFWLSDNSPIHTSNLVQDFFALNVNAETLPWPAKSPDLNPIEHVWAEIKKQIKIHNFDNEDDLWHAIEREWYKLGENAEFCANLVESMPRRLQEVIAMAGGPTHY